MMSMTFGKKLEIIDSSCYADLVEKTYNSLKNKRHKFQLIHLAGEEDRRAFSYRIKPLKTQSPEQAITECLGYIQENHGRIVSQSVQDLPNSEIRISVTVNPPDRNSIIA